MPDYQQRVIEELDQLAERSSKLLHFFDTKVFASLPEAEQVRLKAQHLFMHGYQQILEQRIAAFSQAD